MRKEKNALAVMFKAPEPGKVKTRLVPPLTYEQAAKLYGCFIKDVLNTAKGLEGVDIYGAFAGNIKDGEVYGVSLFEQEGTGLGERIYNVFRALFLKGHERAVVIGSDSPDLPAENIKDAFGLLDGTELVLGPALDGGYYLVAMKRLMDEPFMDIPWSTGDVLEATVKRAKGAAIPFKLLKPWHDIDTVHDLTRLNGKAAPLTANFLLKSGLPLNP
ncbi:MAG: TIGR04282 family arsenosugar biosynthesis glycosyltransferase [Deltaproteobacteria bacterium]|nr:TIGR04282 family arsenosugar biosynthesis glycosyltransferase [Deltaproteobacteria bacterium]